MPHPFLVTPIFGTLASYHFFPGHWDVSDYNNALKLGFDPRPPSPTYPKWLLSQPCAHVLPPRVFAPGRPVARITPHVAQRTGLCETCMVCAGTTDSIAAFLAAGGVKGWKGLLGVQGLGVNLRKGWKAD